MTGRIGDTLTWITGLVALDAAADVGVFTPGRPVIIRRFGYIWASATVTAPETLDIDLDLRILMGSETGRTASQATIAGVAAEAQGEGAYTSAKVATVVTDFEVDADEQVVVQVANAATAGDGYVFIEYQDMPFAGTRLGGLTDRDA